jgi:predicted O-methyltransferase YrrM
MSGMSFEKFDQLYGGSFRTKHLLLVPETPTGRLGLAARFLLGRFDPHERRAYALPEAARLPRDFIRLDPWEAEYLYRCAQEASLGIVEVGRFHGGSTFLFACANPSVPVWSIDVDPQDDGLLRRLFADYHVGRNVELIVGDSQRDELPEIGRFDLLFVDGDHSYEGCLADLEQLVPRLTPNGQIVLHDCYAENPVQRAVLDFARGTELEVVRSPRIPRRHWFTPYGSLAHFTKPPARTSTLASIRPRLVAVTFAAMLLVFMLAAAVPEWLGDKPYNVF